MRDANMYRRIIANAEQLDALALNTREWQETRYSRTIEQAAFYDQDIAMEDIIEENSFVRGYN